MDVSILNLGFQTCRYQDVVYAPADVALTSIGKMAPPSVVAFTLMEQTECIYKTGIHEVLETLALLIGKTFLAYVAFVVCQVIGRVRHIQVTAKNDRLGFFELL